MNTPDSLTSSALMAAATDVLANNGYTLIKGQSREWESATARLFEDAYSIVGVVVFETVTELLRTWKDLQGSLVTLISERIGRHESKSWDGYLVLLTSSIAASEADNLESVRYNTTRLRKIVSTGDDLRTTADVARVLSGLLPLPSYAQGAGDLSTPALDLLPTLLERKKVSRNITEILIRAFRKHSPLLDELDRRSEQ